MFKGTIFVIINSLHGCRLHYNGHKFQEYINIFKNYHHYYFPISFRLIYI